MRVPQYQLVCALPLSSSVFYDAIPAQESIPSFGTTILFTLTLDALVDKPLSTL